MRTIGAYSCDLRVMISRGGVRRKVAMKVLKEEVKVEKRKWFWREVEV